MLARRHWRSPLFSSSPDSTVGPRSYRGCHEILSRSQAARRGLNVQVNYPDERAEHDGMSCGLTGVL